MIPLLVYAAAALVYTWPLVLHPASHLAAPAGPGDPFLNLWILGWGMQTLLRDPAAFFSRRVFDANIFHPADSTLAYSDHLLLQSALIAPVYAVSGSLALSYNTLFAASLVASGLAMHLFVQAVVGSSGAAYLAGLAWAFWPYRFAHLLHIQIQSLYFLPLAFLFLHRTIAGRRRGDAAWLGVTAGLQAVSSVYYAVIGALGLAGGALALAAAVGRWRSGLVARRLLLAACAGAVLVAPIAWVYWSVQQQEGFGRNLFEAGSGAASLSSYLQVPPHHVYARMGLLQPGGPERELFPGFVVAALAAVGLLLGRRSDARPLVVSMSVVGTLGLVVSLGPDGAREVYAALQRYVFGFAAIRAPARFAVLVMFALTTLAALGWRELWSPSRGRTAAGRAGYAVIALAGVECLGVPLPLVPAPPERTPTGQWLAREPAPGAVLQLPLELDIESTTAMVQSLEHRRPIVNGYSGQRPPFYSALVDTMRSFPSDESLVAAHELDVRFVVTPKPLEPPAGDRAWPLVERARLADGVIYEIRWTPEIDARLARSTAIAPEPPGPVPFAPGETATYAAHWSGQGVDLPAGELTIGVRPPPFTFEVRLATAPWISKFFEARDLFVTRTDAQLLPRSHERDQREGSRHVTRAFVYAHEEGLVRVGRTIEHAVSDEGMSLPLAPSSRDAAAALFYARTLPLQPGRRFLIPVNEAGRQLVVELEVGPQERIRVEGRETSAIRLTPRIRTAAGARRRARATLWVSDDVRKVPVALDLDAGFGRIRLELVSYRPGNSDILNAPKPN